MSARPRVLLVTGRPIELGPDRRPAAGWDSRPAALRAALTSLADVREVEVVAAGRPVNGTRRVFRRGVAALRAVTDMAPDRPFGLTAGTPNPPARFAPPKDVDVIWFEGAGIAHHAHALMKWAHEHGRGVVVDLDELVGPRLRAQAELLHGGLSIGAAMHRRWLRTEAEGYDRWGRYLARTGICLVAAPEDVPILGGHTRHVPNVVERPPANAVRRRDGGPPVVGFMATMTYGPNRDAAEHLVADVLPRLRRLIPEVRLVLVGRGSEQIAAGVRGVERSGFAPDLSEALAGFDVFIAPLRLASGTLVKVLTAWAHRVPVVATPPAVRGLGVTSGREALVAGSPDELAHHVQEALKEPVRARLIAAGFAAVEEHHNPSRMRAAVATALEEAMPAPSP